MKTCKGLLIGLLLALPLWLLLCLVVLSAHAQSAVATGGTVVIGEPYSGVVAPTPVATPEACSLPGSSAVQGCFGLGQGPAPTYGILGMDYFAGGYDCVYLLIGATPGSCLWTAASFLPPLYYVFGATASQQIFLVPTGAKRLRITAQGASEGSSGTGISGGTPAAGNGYAGGPTTFGPVIVAGGPSGGNAYYGQPGTPGTAVGYPGDDVRPGSVGSPAYVSLTVPPGANPPVGRTIGGSGAPSPCGGGGGLGGIAGTGEQDGKPGVGPGSGPGGPASAAGSSPGASSGGCVISVIENPAASYTYNVGKGGALGTLGQYGVAGTPGTDGSLRVVVEMQL